jgi:hypothetical protein
MLFQVQQEFALMKLSPVDSVAALFESSLSRRVMKYCFHSGVCLDLIKDYEVMSPGG